MSIDWDGTGLPPARTVCEFQPWKEHGDTWKEITVIAHWCAPNGITYSWGHTGYGWKEPQAMRFRMMRTPEQIAAEERDKAVAEMAGIVKEVVGCGVNIPDMSALYDAGYRKQVKP